MVKALKNPAHLPQKISTSRVKETNLTILQMDRKYLSVCRIVSNFSVNLLVEIC